MVLLIMAIAATLAAPAFARFGTEQPTAPADEMLGAAARRAEGVDRLQRDGHAAPRSENAQVPGRHVAA